MSDPFIARAKAHITKGQKAEARRLLQDYVGLYGNNVEAWLLLAAVSSPHASLEYVQKALTLEPDNPTAQKALVWATGRLNQYKLELPVVAEANPEPKPVVLSEAATTVEPEPVVPPEVAAPSEAKPHLEPVTLRARRHSTQPTRPHVVAQLAPSRPRRFAFISPISVIALVSLVAACLITGFIIVNNSHANAAIPRYVAQLGDLEKATLTYTPTFTATFIPTNTYTPTPTNTPTETPTPIPTDTPTATPTFTFTPTFTATNTPLPTNTLPPPTAAPPTVAPAPVTGDPTGRWIEVNLTNQTLTAWQGDTAVNTFLISSGKWSTQTLPGTFHIYIKLRYARMVGYDYDTPDVPNTMYYDGNFAIHGAYWHNSFGTPVSHGCVNMRVPDSAWLFDWASIGTLVQIHY